MPAASSVFTVDSAHPSLPGHFPGAPVVPGVVVLSHVMSELQQRFPDLRVTGIEKLKFIRMLLPGQLVTVDFDAPLDAALRFKCWQDGAALAEGRLSLRSSAEQPGLRP